MSATGQEQTSHHVRVMSVIPFKADIHQRGVHVRFVPKADIVSREPLAGWREFKISGLYNLCTHAWHAWKGALVLNRRIHQYVDC
jgi:hypothetical protein